MIFHIIGEGDPSVGIPDRHATLEVNSEDIEAYIASIRLEMRVAFREIWGNMNVSVILDEELAALTNPR